MAGTGQEEYEILRNRILDECLIEDWAVKLGYTLKRTGNTFSLKESESCAIYPNTNSFYRYSANKGGSVIDFLVEYGDMDKSTSFKTLAQSIGGNIYEREYKPREVKPKKVAEKPPFVLPKKDNTTRQVFNYLTNTRKIDGAIVEAALRKELIYQDKRKNCVFVGFDKEGVAKYASKRSAQDEHKFVGDVTSSDNSLCWSIKNGGETLVVNEAPIDTLSIMTKLKNEGKDLKQYDFLGMSGVSKINSISRYINEHPNIKKVVLLFDKDQAGITAMYKAKKMLIDENFGGEVVLSYPRTKDINDDIRNRTYKDIELAYRINDENEISTPRWVNPYIADTLLKLNVPLGFVISNEKYMTPEDKKESWYIPLGKGDKPMELFKKGIVCSVNPKYESEERVREITDFFNKVYDSKMLDEVHTAIDGLGHTPTFKEVSEIVKGIIAEERQSNTIAMKLEQYAAQTRQQVNKDMVIEIQGSTYFGQKKEVPDMRMEWQGNVYKGHKLSEQT